MHRTVIEKLVASPVFATSKRQNNLEAIDWERWPRFSLIGILLLDWQFGLAYH